MNYRRCFCFITIALVVICLNAAGCSDSRENDADAQRDPSPAGNQAPQPVKDDYRTVDPLNPETVLNLLPSFAREISHWKNKPETPVVFYGKPSAARTKSDEVLKRADAIINDEYVVRKHFPAVKLARPLGWNENPANDKNWQFNFHALRWSLDLVRAYRITGNPDYLQRELELVESWIRGNTAKSPPSRYSWDHHATAWRAIALTYFWEAYRKSPLLETEFVRLFLASIYQHATFLSDPSKYQAKSNHGINENAALLQLALAFGEFVSADRWEKIGIDRSREWVGSNFSSEGVHLEQTSWYHWYVLLTLSEIRSTLTKYRPEAAGFLTETIEKGADFLQYLLMPDFRLPMIGDSRSSPLNDYESKLEAKLGYRPMLPARESFRLFPEGGYGFYRTSVNETPTDDIWLFARIRSFRSTHCHDDGTHFILYAYGHEWINDSGYYSYHEEKPLRKFVRSSAAHNVVLIDGNTFDYAEVSVASEKRNSPARSFSLKQALPQYDHTRTFTLQGTEEIVIEDVFTPRKGIEQADHRFDLLLHLDNSVTIKRNSGKRVVLVDERGVRCEIEAASTPDAGFRVVSGKKDPLQGWISYEYGKIEKNNVLVQTVNSHEARFVTTIRFGDGQ